MYFANVRRTAQPSINIYCTILRGVCQGGFGKIVQFCPCCVVRTIIWRHRIIRRGAVGLLAAFGVADELTLGVVIAEVQAAAFGRLDRVDGTGGGVPAPRSPQSNLRCGGIDILLSIIVLTKIIYALCTAFLDQIVFFPNNPYGNTILETFYFLEIFPRSIDTFVRTSKFFCYRNNI